MRTYSIYSENGQALSEGIQSEVEARQIAQDTANRLGETVYLDTVPSATDPGTDEDCGEAIEPKPGGGLMAASPFAYFVGSKRYHDTRAVAERIRQTGERFDRSWRDADASSRDMTEAAKAAFYEQCCTFAANDMADHPDQADHWKGYL